MGLSEEQIAAAHWDLSKPGLPLFRKLVGDRVAEAMKGRAEIQSAPDDTTRAIQEQKHRFVEDRIKYVRLIGDAVIAAFFAEDKGKARERKRADVESWLMPAGKLEADWDKLAGMAATLRQGEHPLRPFHWQIEFPEVFARDNGGFDAIVGNPPFLGAKRISSENGIGYRDWLAGLHADSGKNIDLVGHFFRRAFGLVREHGCFGLIASNTIAQGDTREGGLTPILASGGAIRSAVKRLKWPGEAAVVVSVVHAVKGKADGVTLNGAQVARVSAYLVAGDLDTSPARLAANTGRSYQGTTILGMGFTFDDAGAAHGYTASVTQMNALLQKNPKNQTRVFPYLGGEEVNTSPTHAYHRYVIDVSDFSENEAKAEWPDLWQVLEQYVRPERQVEKNKKNGPMYYEWWRFWRPRKDLYVRIRTLDHVFGVSRVSPQFGIGRLPAKIVFADSLVLFAFQQFGALALIQSRIHEIWARFFSSSMKDDLRYAPSDCFETFPFPPGFETDPRLEAAGQAYHDHRAGLMVARNEGMTRIYNRFHDPRETAADIVALRELHAAMDRAVLAAYGWHDLAERATADWLDESNEDDHTYQGRLFWPSPFRDELLSRLLALNASRHAGEVRLGLAPGIKGKAAEEEES